MRGTHIEASGDTITLTKTDGHSLAYTSLQGIRTVGENGLEILVPEQLSKFVVAMTEKEKNEIQIVQSSHDGKPCAGIETHRRKYETKTKTETHGRISIAG